MKKSPKIGDFFVLGQIIYIFVYQFLERGLKISLIIFFCCLLGNEMPRYFAVNQSKIIFLF